MDDEEFAKYVVNSLCALYSDAEDKPGLRVMLKVDSGPGCLNAELLALLRLRGFYLYPGVPNTTAVSQETDRNYSPFKTEFRKIMDIIFEARMQQGLSLSISPNLLGLIIFGHGRDPESGVWIEEGAFEKGFNREQCLKAWAKVGAAPLTMACLHHKQVRRELGDSDDDG